MFNSLKAKIVFPVAIILVLLIAIIVAGVYMSVANLVGAMTEERIEAASQSAYAYLQLLEENSRVTARAISGDQTVIRLVREWNNGVNQDETRQELIRYLNSMNSVLGVTSFVVNGREIQNIVRTHDLGHHGDSQAHVPTHAAAYNNGAVSTVYSSTAALPLGLSSAAPIIDNGEIIGTISAIKSIGTNEFVDDFSRAFNAQVSVFAGSTRIATTILNETRQRAVGTDASDEVVQVVLEERKSFQAEQMLFGTLYNAYYVPLSGWGGNPVGMLFVGFSNETTDAITASMRTTLIGICLVMLLISVFVVWRIAEKLSKPIVKLSDFMNKAGLTGDITLNAEDAVIIERYGLSKDEIGMAISGSALFVKHVNQISGMLGAIAEGDLTIDVKAVSEKDTLGISLQKMVDNLKNMFSEISLTATQVSSGSKQIADGAQMLAQGSTEQAASIQQLSGTIAAISERTKENAETAKRTSQLSSIIKDNAEKGSRQMDEMITAVGEINDASKNISKIIKTIDDIAFQTNILALNAAVEAARAGQHGKGFAVVAEEVRNLASKSAEAAKDTGNMIQASMDKAELGSRIAGETAASLSEIVNGINESTQLITDIADASDAQTQGIAQINIGIDQVAQVVSQNSATAEESAAASEEMSGQSDALEQILSQFRLTDQVPARSNRTSLGSAAHNRLDAPGKNDSHGGTGNFGKY